MGKQQVLVEDGVVDAAEYKKARLRIVWFLREFNDPQRTFTDLKGTLAKFAHQQRLDPKWRATYGTVARVTYGLLNPQERWQSWAGDEGRYVAALAQVAVVNVKKVAGRGTSDWNELEAHFTQHEPQLRAQILGLDPRPDIVIGGNVMWLCRRWCGDWEPRFPASAAEPYQATAHGGTIWVHANHPSKPSDRHRYFERIRDAIQSCDREGGCNADRESRQAGA